MAYEQAHYPDSALATYQQLVSAPDLWNRRELNRYSYALAAAYKRLGELNEARGDQPKALDFYSRFVDLWKDADLELQPVVRDVRTRIARLAGEH